MMPALVGSPLGGNLGATTCSVYMLDPTGTVPLEPVPDLVPGVFTPFRVTIDVVDSEEASSDAETTEHAVQDFLDITSHVRLHPEALSVVGTLGAALPLSPFDTPQPPSGSFLRLDLLRVASLKRLQKLRRPVMVVTPRAAIARAIMTTVVQRWASEDGMQTTIVLTFREIRTASPSLVAAVQDYPAQVPGNNVTTGGGIAPTSPSGVNAVPSSVPGVAPTVGSVA